MRIAICDDEAAVLDNLKALLDVYNKEYDRQIRYDAFESPLELLTQMEVKGHYDALLLDVLMKEDNGIEVAREIRKTDQDVRIVFLTSAAEYAVQSYAVDAFYYALKPVQKQDFFAVLDKLYDKWQQDKAEFILVKCENGINKIHIRDLEYCEVVNRSLILYLQNGTRLKSTVKIKELEEMLRQFGCFIRPHRSYLINLRYVENLSQKSITMKSGVVIPIPHGKYTQTKEQYFAYAFDNANGVL